MNAPNWERIKEVFQDALDRPPHDRASWLRARCGDDRALQAEVESLLATHEQAGGFADKPSVDVLNMLAADSQAFTSVSRALHAGDRLGVYEIRSLLGAGGMGEVYKALDTRLDRLVAVKVLPAHFAADRDRYERFTREARAIASLDHAHICSLYDVGEHDGLHFLVMQYLEGETLAARLANGALPLAQALRYAIEIADALDHAHRHGIVHRDLKPGNVIMTKAGARLLDFGLAKWHTATASALGAARTAQAVESLTDTGLIVGTLHYMAPEQLEGKDVDARTDLFAFAVVVYEMVTGRRPFAGDSSAGVMAAILGTQPPAIATVNRLAPPALDHVVATCLAKDPDARWQSAGDVASELRWIAQSGANASPMGTSTAPRRSRRRIALTAVALLASVLLGAAAGMMRMRASPAAPTPVMRTVVPLPAGTSLAFDANPVAVSPDGTHLAYVAAPADVSRIYLQRLDQFEATPIAGTEGAAEPFFSPDSHWLGFSAGGKLKKVAVSGGAPQAICDADAGFGATWGPDDTIVFTASFRAGLSKCAASGGVSETLTTPDYGSHEKSHRLPQFLPGGRAVLFNIVSADIAAYDDAKIAVLSLDTGKIRVVLDGGTNPRFVSTGHLLYVRGGSLVAVPFDPRRLQIAGESMAVIDELSTATVNGIAHFSVSENGLLAYVRGDARGSDKRVVWVDRHGRVEPLMDLRRPFAGLRLSPDGQRLALSIPAANDQAWIYDLARRTLARLTISWDNDVDSWTPDGKRVVLRSARAGGWNFYTQMADGSGSLERLTESSNPQGSGSWSPDGSMFVFHETTFPSGPQNLRVLDLASHKAMRLRSTPTSFSEQHPSLSPDGRWLAYVSTESGRPEVFVQPFPALGAKWPISTDGGTTPIWSRQGRELFYQNGARMMAVTVQTRPTFVAGTPQLLFEGDYSAVSWRNYDVAPDGRFIMIQNGRTEAPQTRIAIVENWFEELKRSRPTSVTPAR